MKLKKNLKWFKNNFVFTRSIIPTIAPRVIFCTIFSFFIVWLYFNGYNVSLPALINVIPSVILGLLLVFRTNTANERFWEGRKIWGEVNNTISNIARHVWLKKTDEDKIATKQELLEILWLYSLLLKNSLRKKSEQAKISISWFKYISKETLNSIENTNNPPLAAISFIQKILEQYKNDSVFNKNEFHVIEQLLDNLSNTFGGCQRILKTPIPLAYSIHLNQLVIIYCLSLPFQLVGALGWVTVVLVAVTSFAVMGIEEIGAEIENPFGKDSNDLPIDQICEGIKKNLDDLMTLN